MLGLESTKTTGLLVGYVVDVARKQTIDASLAIVEGEPEVDMSDSGEDWSRTREVDDIAAAETACVQLGATRPDHQPGGDRWRVMLDPAGHPFCLTLWSG